MTLLLHVEFKKTVSKLINIQLREMLDDYKIYKLKQNIESITATF